MGIVFERPPAQQGRSSTVHSYSKNLASSSQELRPDTTGTARVQKRESLKTSIQSLHFQSRSGMLNHTGGTYFSHSGIADNPRASIAVLNLGKFLTLWNSKLEVEHQN